MPLWGTKAKKKYYACGGSPQSDRQAFSAFSPAVCQHASSPNGRTSFTEAVHTFSFNITGLKCSFHESVLKKSL